MLASGGRRITKVACCLLVGALAAACSNSETKAAKESPAADPGSTTGETVTGALGSSGSGTSGGSISNGTGLSLDSTSSLLPALGGAGLSVRGSASAAVPADLAFVVVLPTVRGIDSFGDTAIAPGDRKAVMDGLAAIGVPAGDVSLEPDQRTSQARIQVRVPVETLAARGPAVVEVVERTLGRSRSAGATFSLAGCEPAGIPIRQKAVQRAEAEARALADAGKLTLAGIVAVRQEPGPTALRPAGPADGCALVVAGQVSPFDAKPEVTLAVDVSVTYAIAGATTPGGPAKPLLWAGGSATTRTKADEAYVIVVFESEDGSATGGLSAGNRTRLFDGLGKLKIDRGDVQITSRSDYGVTTIVQVETKTAGLATKGREFVRAVEDVLGRSDSSGVRFASSTCEAVLATARRDAVADARQRAAALATAAGVRLGEVQSVSQSTPTAADPCDDTIDAQFGPDSYSSSLLEPLDAEPTFGLTTTAELAFLITG